MQNHLYKFNDNVDLILITKIFSVPNSISKSMFVKNQHACSHHKKDAPISDLMESRNALLFRN